MSNSDWTCFKQPRYEFLVLLLDLPFPVYESIVWALHNQGSKVLNFVSYLLNYYFVDKPLRQKRIDRDCFQIEVPSVCVSMSLIITYVNDSTTEFSLILIDGSRRKKSFRLDYFWAGDFKLMKREYILDRARPSGTTTLQRAVFRAEYELIDVDQLCLIFNEFVKGYF